jgi:hypothetical protein
LYRSKEFSHYCENGAINIKIVWVINGNVTRVSQVL